MLEVFTVAPPPLRRMRAASAVIAVHWPRKLTANCSSISSSLVRSTGPGCEEGDGRNPFDKNVAELRPIESNGSEHSTRTGETAATRSFKIGPHDDFSDPQRPS